ncbi:MAG TPA: outer membrane beta-barrel protein [bacterium]|nr:outer membrane beta-barrel protein [bacterium]
MSWSRAPRLALTLVALTRSLPLAAQGLHVQIGVAGGLSIPTSLYRHADSAGDGFTSGFSALAMVDVKLPKTPVGIRLDVSSGHNSANDSLKSHLSAAVGAPTDARMNLTGVMTNATYNLQPASAARGYFLAGIGFYRVTFSAKSGSTVDTSATKFAWNVGGGLTVGTGVVAWFVEARYLDVAAHIGIKPTGLVTNTGIRVAVGGR